MNIEKICIVGLGYVGLPLLVAFSEEGLDVCGFDLNVARVNDLQQGRDLTGEVSDIELLKRSEFYSNIDDLPECSVYIITVPTPVDASFRPNMDPLISASCNIGGILKKGDCVIYESTVYPGATEEQCVPILESYSGLMLNDDFWVGYSPERINPGDRVHTVRNIKKVTSGSCEESAMFVDALYKKIVTAGTHLAPSIKVAEASKVIENAQRDVNIAFVNELSLIFDKLGIDTTEVLEAASTKWNFLPFKPGLVGGHCIGVDPYYLVHKAEVVGHTPDLILTARRLNNCMSGFIVDNLLKTMIRKRINPSGARVLVLGFSFKENCPDVRNTKVHDLVVGLESLGLNVTVSDSVADSEASAKDYGIELIESPTEKSYDVVVLATPHAYIVEKGINFVRGFEKERSVFCDLKSAFPESESDFRL